jgi:hypothetical protein
MSLLLKAHVQVSLPLKAQKQTSLPSSSFFFHA